MPPGGRRLTSSDPPEGFHAYTLVCGPMIAPTGEKKFRSISAGRRVPLGGRRLTSSGPPEGFHAYTLVCGPMIGSPERKTIGSISPEGRVPLVLAA